MLGSGKYSHNTRQRRKRKILFAIISVALILSLTSCSTGKKQPVGNTPESSRPPASENQGAENTKPSSTGSTVNDIPLSPEITEDIENEPQFTPASEFDYKDYEDGIMIVRYNGDLPDVRVPDMIDGKPVVKIDNEAFSSNEEITTVIISANVTEVGYWAFSACKNLKEVTIPDSVAKLGFGVFWYCTSLEYVSMGNSVTSFTDSLFMDCTSLRSITIPDSVTEIWGTAFEGCTALTNVTIPKSVETISEGAFSIAGGDLYEINIDEDNEKYSSVDGVLFNKDKTILLMYPPGKPQDSYAIPDGVKTVARNAFLNHRWLTSVTIPESVTSIDDGALNTKNGNISEISVDAGNGVYSSVDGVLFSKDKTVLVSYPSGRQQESYTIPSYVSTIKGAEWQSSASRTYTGGAFGYCGALLEVSIPNSVTSIGKFAFYGCSGLTEVTIPNSVKHINESVFSHCTGLTSVTMSDSIESVYINAFYECRNIANVYYKGQTFRGWNNFLDTALGNWSKY